MNETKSPLFDNNNNNVNDRNQNHSSSIDYRSTIGDVSFYYLYHIINLILLLGYT